MLVAIIIPTYNRAGTLPRLLASLAGLEIPAGIEPELLLVDNNSTDDTRAICERTDLGYPLRYIFEPQPGKCFAVNRALDETKAELILFTDDDVVVEKDWLSRYCDAAARVPEASYFGGNIFPRWEETPPRWFADHASTHLAWLVLHLDLGKTERFWESGVAGANMAIRRSALVGVRFNTSLGPDGTETVRGEENDLINRLRAAGHRGWLVPSAVVYHYSPARRMTEAYVRLWFKGDGMTEARCGKVTQKNPWFGVSRYYWKRWALSALKLGLTRWTAPASVWLPAEIAMAQAWGVIVESRRQAAVRAVS